MHSSKSSKEDQRDHSLIKLKISRLLFGWSLCALWIPWEHFAHITNFGYFRGALLSHIFKDTLAEFLGRFLFEQGLPGWAVLLVIGVLTAALVYGFIAMGRKLRKKGAYKQKKSSFIRNFIMKLPRQ